MKLIYVMDPQCGWCFANGDNVTALYNTFKDKLHFELKVGGMWLGSNAPKGGEGLHNFVSTHGSRLTSATGVEIPQAYYELCKDPSYTFSSLEGSAAVIWVKQQAPDQGLPFAKAVQNAQFVEGKKLDDINTYLPILTTMGLDQTQFKQDWMSEKNLTTTQEEFKRIQSFVRGFPALLIEENGKVQILASGYFRAADMQQKIEQMLAN